MEQGSRTLIRCAGCLHDNVVSHLQAGLDPSNLEELRLALFAQETMCFFALDRFRGDSTLDGRNLAARRNARNAVTMGEGLRRHEAIRSLLGRHKGPLRSGDVRDFAWELGVSQATLYRLITIYKAAGTVEALMPRTSSRPVGLRDKKVEALILKCIREIYLAPNQPTMKPLIDGEVAFA